MRKISNSDYDAVVRLLGWAASQGGGSVRDAEKRRQATILHKKLKNKRPCPESKREY